MAISKKTPRQTHTQPVGSLIDRVLEKYRLADDVFLSRLAAEKEEIFGHFAAHLTPVEFINGILKLQFDSDAWRHEAELSRQQLLSRINEFAPGKVRRIFFI